MGFIRNAWYCAALSDEIGNGLLARRILGEPILLTRDAEGEVRAIGDRCPHRFAPLHLGERFGDVVECPYHGLRFDLGGACIYNPHGSGRIPDAARVQSYPVREHAGVIWLWPGEAKLAAETGIPDLQLVDRGSRPPISGHLTMPVDYRLVLDNLMDLSHAAYIHAGTLTPSRARREASYHARDRAVRVDAIMRDVETPLSQALYFEGKRGDFHSGIEWVLPGTVRQRLAMSEVGADPDSGSVTRNAHLITPETEHSTHYFWLHTRNRLMDDQGIDARTKALINNAFTTEDEPMLMACQDYMDGQEFFSLQPLYLETDFAGTRCRRIIERVIALEQGGEVAPAPAPALASA